MPTNRAVSRQLWTGSVRSIFLKMDEQFAGTGCPQNDNDADSPGIDSWWVRRFRPSLK